MTPSENRPLSNLVGDVFREGAALVRGEALLARTEVSEKLGRAVAGLTMLILGAVFLIGALNVLLAAAVTGLADAGMEPWLASLIVTVGAGLIGVILLRVGINRMKGPSLLPERTADQLRKDATLVRETAQ